MTRPMEDRETPVVKLTGSVEEVCIKCGATTFVLIGDGSEYVPKLFCDDCQEKLKGGVV